MIRPALLALAPLLLAVPAVAAPALAPAEAARRLVADRCVKCHGPDKQAGDVRLDDLPADPARAPERWLAVAAQVHDGLMPPSKEPRLPDERARALVLWASEAAGVAAARLPNQGNLVPHELLFGKPAGPAGVPAPRVWRLSPDGYTGLVREVARGGVKGLVQPFTLTPERGVRDFAGLYTVDEPSAEVLVRNAEAIVAAQTAHEIKDGKVSAKGDTVGEFVKLMDPALTPSRPQIEAAIQTQFRMAVGRPASADDLARFVAFYERLAKGDDRPAALKTTLAAVLLKTDALYRSELGAGPVTGAGEGGRRMLAPDELARAVSLALGDRRESGLVAAAQKGELTTREQVAAHARRVLDDPKAEKPRLLAFFREYFEYHKALDVFKDKPKPFVHEPRQLVADTDRLVLHVLAADKDVFRELLTTPRTFANYSTFINKQKGRIEEGRPGVDLNPNNNKGQSNVETVYGFAEWPAVQPAELPKETRLGVLMQPAWLAAWSTNFDNDPVRRGRWVRERLLGGTVPDLPIGVAAQVPDEPHRTFRDRLTVTRAERCWKCHRQMDDLGLPFEQFDHYGRFRTTETVRDDEATARNVDKKGKPLGPVTREVLLDTGGLVAGTGDKAVDGPVKDPRELVRRLADSDRARQVFVRHAFRFFLGRNETLSDARALQDADRAYVESGGSFRALVVSLLTSDAFLYRSAPGGTK